MARLFIVTRHDKNDTRGARTHVTALENVSNVVKTYLTEIRVRFIVVCAWRTVDFNATFFWRDVSKKLLRTAGAPDSPALPVLRRGGERNDVFRPVFRFSPPSPPPRRFYFPTETTIAELLSLRGFFTWTISATFCVQFWKFVTWRVMLFIVRSFLG